MDWDTAGSLALGIVVMYVAMMFITRNIVSNSTAVNLGAFFGVILGGIVVQFLTSQIGANKTNFSQYAVGLLIGLVAYVVTYRLTRGTWPTIGPD